MLFFGSSRAILQPYGGTDGGNLQPDKLLVWALAAVNAVKKDRDPSV